MAQLEAILGLYALPYDPQHPVVCVDERPLLFAGGSGRPSPDATGASREGP